MKILIDMNLPPRWVDALFAAGHDATHWSAVGSPSAPDVEVMAWAKTGGYVVFTHDLDFSGLLARSGASCPSIVQVRTRDVLPETLGPTVLAALSEFADDLGKGAIVTIEPDRARSRVLPLRPDG